MTLSCLSVSKRGVIGRFCVPNFSVWPAKFESFLSRAPDWPQRNDKYLTHLVFSVHTAIYGSLFQREKTRSVTYIKELELG